MPRLAFALLSDFCDQILLLDVFLSLLAPQQDRSHCSIDQKTVIFTIFVSGAIISEPYYIYIKFCGAIISGPCIRRATVL